MPDLPTLDTVLNFRELGGLEGKDGVIAHGRVYRSGHLTDASDSDLEKLAALGLHTIVDLRTAIDIEGDGGPDRAVPGSISKPLPVVDNGGRVAEIRRVFMARDQRRLEEHYGDGRARAFAIEGAVGQALDPEKQAVYGEFLKLIAATDNQPLLFHCSAGKDRAGWAATLAGIAVGVPDASLVDHYLLSNAHGRVEHRLEHFASMGIDATVLMPLLQVETDYLVAALDAIDSRWGSREQYFDQALGIDGDALEDMRSALLI